MRERLVALEMGAGELIDVHITNVLFCSMVCDMCAASEEAVRAES